MENHSQPAQIVNVSNGVGSATASMIVGIFSLMCSLCITLCGIPFALVGLGLALYSFSQTSQAGLSKNGMAIAGLVLSVVALLLGICSMAGLFGLGMLGMISDFTSGPSY